MAQKVSGLLNELRPSRETAEEVVAGHELTGKTIVVTGGNSGRCSSTLTCLLRLCVTQSTLILVITLPRPELRSLLPASTPS